MTTDAQGSRVVLTADGSEPDRLSDLVHQVAYLNTREFPSPGKRIVQLATTLHCKYVLSILTQSDHNKIYQQIFDEFNILNSSKVQSAGFVVRIQLFEMEF